MNIKDILNISQEDIMSMNTKELKKVVQQMSNVSKQRVRRLEKANIHSHAKENILGDNEISKTRNMNINQLRSEYKKLYSFLNAKTSTVGGAKQVEKELIDRLGFKQSAENTTEKINTLFDAFGRIEQLAPAIVKDLGSARLQEYIASQIDKNMSIDDIVENSLDWLNELYENEQTTPNETLFDFW